MRLLCAALVLALLFPACASRAAAPPLRPAIDNPDAHEQLRRDLRAMFTDAALDHAEWSASFSSLHTGETLYSLNSFRFMIPASAQKLLTAAAAAERLGWDYRFTTRLLSTAAIAGDGSIDGDVVVVSNGDPTINPRHPARWRAFDDWAATLKARGVTAIRGRLIGDDNAIAEPGWGFGWSWDDLHYGYGAAPSALQYNENQVSILIGPGLAAGSRAIVGSSPATSGLVIEHSVTTIEPAGQTRIDFSRLPGSVYLSVRGQIAAGAEPVSLTASIDNPTRFYLTSLRDALARHGIAVSGGIADIDDVPHVATSGEGRTELVVDHSPPLHEIVDVTLKWSRNIYAETLLLAMTPEGEPASAERGLAMLRETLHRWGIPAAVYLPRDGSGLSRYDYVTADALTWLLTYVWRDPTHAERFRSTLPVSGASGTLASRMKGTPAEGRVLAKTGSMSHVRSIAGYVTTLAGEPIVFAILANDFRVAAADIEAVADRALNRIVQFTRSQSGQTTPPSSSPPLPPPTRRQVLPRTASLPRP